MDYRLKAISQYNKKSAKKTNHYKRFKPGKDQILIDDDFAVAGEKSIAFTDSKTDYKKALKSAHPFVYYKPKGLLVFNANGSKSGAGSGGPAAVFKKKTDLDQSNFDFSEVPNPSSSQTPQKSTSSDLTTTKAEEQGTHTAKLREPGESDLFPFDLDNDEIAYFSVKAAGKYPMLDITGKNENILSKKNGFDSDQAELRPYENRGAKASLILKTSSQTGQTGDFLVDYSIKSIAAIKTEVVELTNQERSKRGLDPLTRNQLLDEAAQGHANDMDASGAYLAHIGSNGSTAEQRIKATGYKAGWHDDGSGKLSYPRQENVAYGQDTAKEVVKGWMNSPGHKAAIIDPTTQDIGIGFEIDDASGITYWVQTFGHPLSAGGTSYF